ncbi:MAG: hypothetical protein E7227_02755 [Clostridiales bacterium]|nr:hypothetical protein [Clostridiales bacterium]
MYGAILGDIIGSPYEFDRGNKTKDFPFFDKGASFTDDSVMTIAVAEALIEAGVKNVIDDEAATKELLIDSIHKWGHKYPDAGYGGRFYQWLRHSEREPYGSWGNGSAMRVAAAGWLYDDLEITRKVARWTAEVTHNHPEGVKGAESTAAAIWMARNGKTKEEIKVYIVKEFGYDLSRTCDEIRPGYHHIESCQETVPEAITAFLEGNDFEDVIRTAVSLGGDCDTLTCIAGSIAEAYYGVSEELMMGCENRLPLDMLDILLMFHGERRADLLKVSIATFSQNRTTDKVMEILWYLKSSLLWVPCNAVLSERDQKAIEEMALAHEDDLDSLKGTSQQFMDEVRLIPDILISNDEYFFPAFTSPEDMGDYGNSFSKVQKHIMEIISLARNNENDVRGVVINAFGDSFVLEKELYSIIEDANKENLNDNA